MVYSKKPDLSRLPEFGAKVWVHDPDGSKLGGRAQDGHWVGFDEVSSGHRIYIQGKHTIAVERSVKLDRDDVLVPIPGDLLFEGEQEEDNQPLPEISNPNTMHQPAVPPIPPTTPKQSPLHTPPRTPPTSTLLPMLPSVAELRKQLARKDPLGPDFEEPAVEETPAGRSQRVRKPLAYIQSLQSGAGRTSNCPSDPTVPKGIRVPAVVRHTSQGGVLGSSLTLRHAHESSIYPTLEKQEARIDRISQGGRTD
ncbi:hypothetical protein B0H16DRAFT_89316 [Mycena metata]|uniref:Retroviral polymerase SH3-like domain-containing protein n=1 Tax=Mycena metata TaxID=1033252 RepID=A0AAD7ICC1_9AGAR|nr:hypothetical protein B0H16DRAFT_89316 [Mycena metata]